MGSGLLASDSVASWLYSAAELLFPPATDSFWGLSPPAAECFGGWLADSARYFGGWPADYLLCVYAEKTSIQLPVQREDIVQKHLPTNSYSFCR